jgi:hypothetical protein
MNNRLDKMLNRINDFYLYSDDVIHQYILLINEAIDLINETEAPPTSFLENAKNEALTKLRNELANRMNESFFHAPLERRKNEFKISKMLVGVSIGNVLSDMLPESEG